MRFFRLLNFFLLGLPGVSKAQLCAGNAGDPIVNITFGTGRSRLPDNITSYEYTNGCPAKGTYTVSNFLLGCGDRTWFLLAGDHTRNVDGAYMVVNAESAPGTIHIDTANGLCGNTTYQFSAWITNVMQKFTCGANPILPDLTFNVQTLAGVTLATYKTGNLPIEEEKIWKQFGLSFKTPAAINSVILRITTNPPFGCGSSFAIDDITLTICGPASVNATIDGNTGPEDVCADYKNPFLLRGSYSPGFADPVTQWQSSTDTGKSWNDIPGEINATYSIPRRNTGMVLYRFAAAERTNINSVNCRTPSNVIYTNVHPLPAHHPPADIRGCTGKDLLLPQADPSALEVLFTGPNGYLSDLPKSVIPNVQYPDTGMYTLKQTFYFGCTSIDTFHLKVFPGTTINALPLYSICENRSITLFAAGDGKFKWTPSTGLSDDTIPNPVAKPHDTTVYKVMVTNSSGCQDSANVTVNVFRNPVVSAGTDKEIMKGDSVILNGTVGGTAINFSWNPFAFIDESNRLNPTVFPPEDSKYTLTAISNVGCGTASSTVSVKVYKDIYIPTAFTPNGDGRNDNFKVSAANSYKLKNFLIYNRWGELVFNEPQFKTGWNGKFKGLLQPVGPYIYYLEVQSPSGKTVIKKGIISLLK